VTTTFTPLQSLFGGALIGLSAVLLMLTLGRVMGATGILRGAVFPESLKDWAWRIAVLAGMVSAPFLVLAVSKQLPAVDIPISAPLIALGGLLVGIGVSWGGGCTSGHGVCGMARFSIRSVIATVTFMVTTFITVYVVRHVF